MTHAEEILDAVANIITVKGQDKFTRADVRDELGFTSHKWDMGYTAIFQDMIEGCPKKSLRIKPKYRSVFKRIERKIYILTPYGQSLLEGRKQFNPHLNKK